MLKKIKLLGHLGKKFGREYSFDVASPAEAVKALCHQVRGFREYMQKGAGKERRFKIVVGKNPLTDIERQFHMCVDSDISIVPIVKGAGGLVETVTGWWMTLANIAYEVFSNTLAGRLLNGIMEPKKADSPVERNKNDDRSYLFNGAVNTTQQGQPIPIGYGRMKIGSQVVSASLSTTQIAI